MEKINEKTTITTQLDQLFSPWNKTNCPGLVIGVRHKDQLLYRRAVGMASLETATANSLATRMRIGSTSKHFLGLLALLMQEQGLVDLDKPIGDYLPELSAPNDIPSLRQLLQHRGGTRCHIDLGLIGHGMHAAPEGSALQTLTEQNGTNFTPGTAMLYNNGGYHLISLALARLAGQPLETLLQKYLLEPLGMYQTTLVQSDYNITPGMASMHLLPLNNGIWRRGIFPSNEILGEGGLISTVDDMLKWARHLRTRHSFGTDETWDQFFNIGANSQQNPGYYGLGIMRQDYRGITLYRHAGGVKGGSSEFIVVPEEELDIIVISNGAPSASPNALAIRVVDIVLADHLEPPAVAPSPKTYDNWIGNYGSVENGMVYSLENIQDALYLRIAKYAVPAPLEASVDGRLCTGFNGLGTIKVLCTTEDNEQTSISLEFAGREERLLSIAPASPREIEEIENTVPGNLESRESGLFADIKQRDGQLWLLTQDQWGAAHFELQPMGGQWLAMRSWPDPDQFGATLWFQNGWGSGFKLNSARTRNLSFERT